MLIEKHNGGEMASRECSSCYSKRNREKHIFLTSLTYLLGISKKLKSRLILWSSGDISLCRWFVLNLRLSFLIVVLPPTSFGFKSHRTCCLRNKVDERVFTSKLGFESFPGGSIYWSGAGYSIFEKKLQRAVQRATSVFR